MVAALLAGACQSSDPAGGMAAPAEPAVPAGESIAYRLVAVEPAAGPEATQQREILAAVRAALAAQGLREPGRAGRSELVVAVDYRVGPPHASEVSETEALYEVTPGKEEYESVSLGIGPTGGTIYDMKLVKQPDTRVYVGERPVLVTRTVYEKRLRLSARVDAPGPASGVGGEAWSVELIAVGQRRDFKKLLPVLMGAARPFLGPGTAGATVLQVNEDSGVIESVDRTL
jgi:hypothetical protein